MSFGQLGLLTRRRRSATIISEGCQLLILDKADYDRIIKPSQIGKNTHDYLINYLRNIFPFKKLSPKTLMSLAIFTEKRILKPRIPIFQQQDKALHLWVVIQGSVIISKTTKKAKQVKQKTGTNKKYGNQQQTERHELEICPVLTILGIKEVFQSKGIPTFEYDAISGEEGCTCLGIPIHVMREVYNKDEIFKKTNRKTYSNNDNVALQESYEWLVKYSERRAVWHSIRNEFCFEYANISLNLTRKLQTAHYSQCGRCGRTTHDALDSFVCPLDGFDSLPPLNQEDEDKRKEERKRKAKEKMNLFKKTNTNNNILANALLFGSISPKKIFSLNAGDDQSKAETMLSAVERTKMLNLASRRKKKQTELQNAKKTVDTMESVQEYLNQQHEEFHRTFQHHPTKPTADNTKYREKPGRRTFIYTPVIPFLSKTPEFEGQHIIPAATKDKPYHEQAIKLIKHGKKYGRKCRSMLQETYPNFNISEKGKYIKKSVHCGLCKKVGHIRYNCPLVPITELEQRKILNDILQERELFNSKNKKLY